MAPLEYGQERQIFQKLLGLGYSPAGAAGKMGNVYAESSGNPQAFNEAGGGKGAWGGFQWRGNRQDNAKKYMSDNNLDPNDIWSHYVAADDEIRNRPGDAMLDLAAYNQLDDPAAAATMFRKDFERPGEDTAGYKRAIDASIDYYNRFSGLDPIEQKPGYKFAEDADARARGVQDILRQKVASDDTTNLMMLRALTPGKFSETLNMGMAQSQPDMRRGNPQLGYGTGEPQGGSAPSSGGDGGSRTAAVSTSGNPEEEPLKKKGLMDRIFRPEEGEEEEPWYRRGSFTDTLAGLSAGLSQMSHGQPVDVMSTVSDLRSLRDQRRSQLADAERADAQLALDTINAETAQQNAMTSRTKAALDAQQLAFDQSQAIAEGRPMDSAALDLMVKQYPTQLGPMVDMYRSQVQETGIANPDLGQDIVDHWKSLSSEGQEETLPLSADGQAFLRRALNTENNPMSPSQMQYEMIGLPPGDIERVNKALENAGLLKPLEVQKVAEGLVREDNISNGGAKYGGDITRAIPDAQRLNQDNELEAEIAAKEALGNVEQSLAYTKENSLKLGQGAALGVDLARAEEINNKLLKEGQETSGIKAEAARWLAAVDSMLPGDLSELSDAMGFDVSSIMELDSATNAVALSLGKMVLQGQGAVSDGERKSAYRAFLSSDMSAEERAKAITRFQVAADIDRRADAYYRQQVASRGARHHTDILGEVNSIFTGASVQLGAYAAKMDLLDKTMRGQYANSPYKDLLPQQQRRLMTPTMTKQQAELMPEYLSLYNDSQGGYMYIDADTGLLEVLKMPKREEPVTNVGLQ